MTQSDKSKTKARIQNTVRGALALMKSASVPKRIRTKWQQEQAARQQIHRAMAMAQKVLSRQDVAELERWIGKQQGWTKQTRESLGPPLTSLALLPLQLMAKDAVSEINFSVAQLMPKVTSLLEVCDRVLTLQRAFSASEWVVFREILQDIGDTYGRSYFELELRVAVEQAISGVDGMKALTAKLAAAGGGPHQYLMYMFGVRNEPAQTAARFKDQASKKLNEANDIGAGIKAYLIYRLTKDLPLDDRKLASVLCAERMGSELDLLFTLLAVVRHIQSNNGAFSHRLVDAAKDALDKLTPFISALGLVWPKNTNFEHIESPILYHNSAIDIFLKNPSDLLALGHAALDQLWLSSADSIDGADQIRRIVRGVFSRLSTQDSGVAGENLEKIILNMGELPILSQIGSTTDVPKFVSVYLNCLDNRQNLVWPQSLKEAISVALTVQLNRDDHSISNSSNAIVILAAVMRAMHQNNIDEALRLLADDEHLIAVERDTFQIVSATLYQRSDQLAEAIKIIAKAGVRNPQLISLLPLDAIFRGARWASLICLGPSIELSVCLDLYLRNSGDRRATTYKRFSVEELIKLSGCLGLIDLMNSLQENRVSSELIEYFFDNVCDISTLELLPSVGNSKKAQELRIEVLRCLSGSYPVNGGRYREEADLIEAGLIVNDGLEILDASRVYVDDARILPTIHRELSADFQRYLDLVRSGVGVSESFAEILKSIKHPSEKTFQIPTNDAEDLFGEMTLRIREKFLFDPASGLDIHVGRRIRHGTIASQIRGPLENRSLIGQRPKIGADYDPPEAVRGLLITLDPKAKQRLCAAFSRFSESIDGLIVLLRDEYFHVRSKDKSRGMFDVPINPVSLALTRSIAQTCPSIEDYSRHCVQMFWMLLSAKMAAARPPMESETRKSIGTFFEKLIQELRAIGVSDPSLHASLQQALEELRRRVAELGSWMRVPKSSIEGRTYGLQRCVDVAIALVKGQRAGFKPEISSSVPPNLELDYYGFSVVVDTLYIAIDNISAHSGKKVDNKVDIQIAFSREKSLISFEVKSELGKDGWSSEKEVRLNSIKASISKRAYADSARKDKHSGLSKLAALVLQDDSASISFEFIKRTHFLLKFDLHYVQSDRVNRGSYDELIDSFDGVDSIYPESST